MPLDREDAALVEAFQRGEESAFTALVIKYRETVYRLARRLLGSHEDGADITQEVFLRAYRALPRFDGRAHLRTWLYRITVNLCLDHQARRRHLWVELEEGTAEAPPQAEPAARAQAAATARAIARAVAALPPRQRATVALRLYQDLPYAEIAQILGCSEGTVKATMFAALRRLRAALAAEWSERP